MLLPRMCGNFTFACAPKKENDKAAKTTSFLFIFFSVLGSCELSKPYNKFLMAASISLICTSRACKVLLRSIKKKVGMLCTLYDCTLVP